MTTALGFYTVSLTFEVRNSSVNLGMQRINLKRGHLNMREVISPLLWSSISHTFTEDLFSST